MASSFEGFRRMMQELDHDENKELTAALSLKTIDIIGADPARLNSRDRGDESPWGHWINTMMDRLLNRGSKPSDG